MSFSLLPRPVAAQSGRDPAHVLYDHACDVLVAAQSLRAAAGLADADAAVPATFGCLESAVDALAEAIQTLAPAAVAHLDADSGAAGRLALQCQDASDVLRVGRDVIGSIRDQVGTVPMEDDA
jgi:hypothetical protein